MASLKLCVMYKCQEPKNTLESKKCSVGNQPTKQPGLLALQKTKQFRGPRKRESPSDGGFPVEWYLAKTYSFSWFCFSGDFIFWALLRYLLGNMFFFGLLKQIQVFCLKFKRKRKVFLVFVRP